MSWGLVNAGLWDKAILELWQREAPSVSPVWAVTLYQDSRAKKLIGPVYVRAACGERALAWAQRNRSLIGWRGVRAHHYGVRPVHPTELGMVPTERKGRSCPQSSASPTSRS